MFFIFNESLDIQINKIAYLINTSFNRFFINFWTMKVFSFAWIANIE